MKNQQNVLISTDVFLLWYWHLQVLTGNPTISRETFPLQEHSAIRRVRGIEIPMIIGWNFL
jgi:hypothetical protein